MPRKALGTANTDWQKEIYRTAVSHDHNVAVQGAFKNLPYRLSVGYTGQQGILKTTNFRRVTAALNLNPSFFRRPPDDEPQRQRYVCRVGFRQQCGY